MLKKPPSAYYKVNDLAKKWGWDVSEILLYGETGELQLCLLVPNQALMEPIWRLGLNSIPIKYPSPDRACVVDDDAFGNLFFNIRLIENSEPIPISKEDALKIRTAAGLSLRETICGNLVITHEEKLRLEKENVFKKEMVTERERENLLRLIGAFIEIHYQGNDYKKKDGSPNANKISEKFHEQLALNNFSDKGLSDKSFRKLIPEAYNLIMENKTQEKIEEYTYAEDKPNKLKKIPST